MAFGDLARDLKKLEELGSETDYDVYFVKVDADGNYSCPKQLFHGLKSKEDFEDWLKNHDAGKNGKFVLYPNIPDIK
ncbi:MAG: hypothetical protein IJZ36_04995 [Bacilli bacterium]|nr:hypothetical protein [Bacilli bacterium]